jgi:hypothetical protein
VRRFITQAPLQGNGHQKYRKLVKSAPDSKFVRLKRRFRSPSIGLPLYELSHAILGLVMVQNAFVIVGFKPEEKDRHGLPDNCSRGF